MNLKLQIAFLVDRWAKKMKYNPSSKNDTVRYYRRLISHQNKINLADVLEYFSKHPAAGVDPRSLNSELAQSHNALRILRKNIDELTAIGTEIPKVVWMYWNSGLKSAPEVVQLAYQSWKVQNPDWEVYFLDDSSIGQYLDTKAIFKLSSLDLTVAHKSDFIRTYLLASHGGVWADSTTFCWQPLSRWLFDETLDTGFFVFRQPEGTKDRQITNWFIASSIRNPITTGLFNALCDYLFKPREVVLTMRHRRCYVHYENISRTGTDYRLLNTMERENTYPYLFYHYLFNEVVAADGAKGVWQRVVLARNNYAKRKGEIGDAFVSKQTYKGDYVFSETYVSRRKMLMSQIENRTQQ